MITHSILLTEIEHKFTVCLLILFVSPYIIYYEKGCEKMLEYISVSEAAKKWGISERRVQKLCEDSRIPRVAKFSYIWLIPKDAKKPNDRRLKENNK